MNSFEQQLYEKAYERAYQLFGNKRNAHGWLNEPSIAMGNVIPRSLLATEQGLDRVLYELGQMEYGHPV